MKEVKLYKVTFVAYTNCMNDTVSDYYEGRDLSVLNNYIHIPVGGLIIREDEIEYYKKFGRGISTLNFVGTMIERTKGEK